MEKRYDHKIAEEKWKKLWAENDTYKFQYTSDKPMYSVDTPPPYVSAAHLHSGHIMSYSQAEFVVRYKRMQGYNVFYPMGFDDNGLPTERYVEKKYNVDKSKISRKEFIELCLKETKIGSQNYKDLWTNLGISVDWSKTYSTINPLATEVSQKSLINLYDKGYLYRKDAPIIWCPFCQTAVAQADLEDKEFESFMNYIKFESPDGRELTIATTRPELLPACVALYVNPQDERFTDIIGKTAKVPLFNYEVPIKSSEQVDPETGTGLMMVCTWGDQEDLEKWETDNLETRKLFTKDGKLNKLGKKYEGLKILEARKLIINDLKEEDLLTKQKPLKHAVNVHERCDTPVEFISSKQWFIQIAENKERWLTLGNKINWYPKWRKKDYDTWVKNLKWDWCISRQRYYGVPFPIWYCDDCGEIIFAKEEDLPVHPTEQNPSLDECPKCKGRSFTPEKDVMDTWATSSCTPFLIKELVNDDEVRKRIFPVSLRPNAFEIIRTWDFYSIVKGFYNFGKAAFEDVMISGHGMDEKGEKISKRLGNYIPPQELLEEYGADAIRYWATGATLGNNLRFNIEEVDKGKKTANKLWNAARFLSMNEPIDTETHLEPADTWILKECNKTIETVTKAFEKYEYASAKSATDEFFWSKFADYYIEFVKYRIFGDNTNSKNAAINTLYRIFLQIIKMYAPIMPFVTEEIYHELYGIQKEKSLHLSSWPKEIMIDSKLDITDFEMAIQAIDEIRKYKSEQGMSLGKVLDTYKLKTDVDLDKYGEFIKKAIRVEKLQ